MKPDAPKDVAEDWEISPESERASKTSHFLRQSIISRRREADWINRRWYQNQRFTSLQTPWTR